MPLEPAKTGLLARTEEYQPLRAFSQTGRYWDRVPQQLIREGGFAEFLPPVESEEDERGKFGRFHRDGVRKEWLSRSQPVGRRGIPAVQLERLRKAVEDFKLKANTQRAQPQNLELIQRFKLPDIAHDPELYRLAGPWWDRRLQILWGCERTRDSSLPAATAADKLHPDKFYNLRRALTALLLLLLLLLPAWWLCSNASRLLSRPARQAEAQRKADQAAHAAEAAAQAEAGAERAQAAATKAKADALAARKAADRAKAANDAVTTCRIVLCGQDQPEADGTMSVALEVRAAADPLRPVPVEAWYFENQTVTAQDRLQTKMKPGAHTVKAAIRDAAGERAEISAAVTVEPGKIITTPGKVSVKQK
ncbi:MAG TPA: hypothetical protein VN829_07905 [Dongiaceae bacterium]|nr:hypothetical protein [Dongiaceae bacterium]